MLNTKQNLRNRKITEYKTTVETKNNTKYASFETDHFSTYILAEKGTVTTNNNSENTGTSNNNNNQNKGELDETPKTGDYIYIVCTVLAMIIVANVGLIIYRIKK